MFSRDLVCSCNGAGPAGVVENNLRAPRGARGSVARICLDCGIQNRTSRSKGHKLAKERRVKDSAQALVLVVQSLRKNQHRRGDAVIWLSVSDLISLLSARERSDPSRYVWQVVQA